MKRAWLIFSLLLLAGIMHAQSYSTKSKKAIKLFDQAVEYLPAERSLKC